MNGQQPNLDNWDDFSGKWFKAEHVKSWPATVQVMNVTGEIDSEDNVHLYLDIVYNKKKLKFEPNKTNQEFIKCVGVTSPKALIGRQIVFVKTQNFNPTTKKRVDALLIDKVI